MIQHIVFDFGPSDPPICIVTALCGAQAILCDTRQGAQIAPADFDFYLLGHGHEKATCAACRTALQTIQDLKIEARVNA